MYFLIYRKHLILYNNPLQKLYDFNFSIQFVNLIKSYLSSRSQLVKIDHFKSNLLGLSTGVPQLSILGPILFINDLPKECEQCNDDTVIFTHGKCRRDCKKVDRHW